LSQFDEEDAMTLARILAALFLLILLPPRSDSGQDPSLLGFWEAQAKGQLQLEARFDSFLRVSNLEL
jgi:hypothetical protein